MQKEVGSFNQPDVIAGKYVIALAVLFGLAVGFFDGPRDQKSSPSPCVATTNQIVPPKP